MSAVCSRMNPTGILNHVIISQIEINSEMVKYLLEAPEKIILVVEKGQGPE